MKTKIKTMPASDERISILTAAIAAAFVRIGGKVGGLARKN